MSTFNRLVRVLWVGVMLLAVGATREAAAQTSGPTVENDPAAFCRAHLGLLESADMERILADYAETVNWYKDGVVNHDFIRQDKGKFYADWPDVRYEVDGPIRVHKTGEETEISFRSLFAAAGVPPKNRRSVGRAENVWKLRWTGNTWQIVSENQKVTGHELPPAAVAQLFARTPAGGVPAPTTAAAYPTRPGGVPSTLPPGDLTDAVAAYHRLRKEARSDLIKGMSAGSAARAAKILAENRLATDANNPRLLITAAEASVFCRELAKADEYASRAAALLANVPTREQDAKADALSVRALVAAQPGANLAPQALSRLETLATSAMNLLRQPGVPRDSDSARHARLACEETVDTLSARNVGLYTNAINLAGGRPNLELLHQQAEVARCALRIFARIPEPDGWSEAGATKNLVAVDYALGFYYQEFGAWEEGARRMERLPDLPEQRDDLPDLAGLAESYGSVYARLGNFAAIEKLADKASEVAANTALARGAQPFVVNGIRANLTALRKIYPAKDDPRAVVGGGLLPVDDQPLPERVDGAGFQMLGGGEGTSVVFNPDANLQGAGAEYDWPHSGPVVSRSNRLMVVPKFYAQNRHSLGGNCAVYDLQAGLALGTVILPETQPGASVDFNASLALAFSPDDRFLVLGYPERVYVCDLRTGRLAYSLALPKVKSLAIDAAGRQLVCATPGSVYRCDLPTGEHLKRSNLPRGVDDLRLSEDAARLTAWSRTGSEEMTCTSWETASGRASAHFTCAVPWEDSHHLAFLGVERITSLQTTSATRNLAVGGPWPQEKWHVLQWNTHDGRLVLDQSLKETLPGLALDARPFDAEALWNVSLSGRWLTRQGIRPVAPGANSPAVLYYDLNAQAGGPLTALERGDGFGRYFSPNEQFTVGTKEDNLLLGDFQRGLFAKTLQPAQRLGASGLAFSRNGSRLAVSYDDGSLRIFDLPHSRLERALTAAGSAPGHGGVDRFFYSRPEFSPDDRYLLVRRETFGKHPTTSFEVYRTDTSASVMRLRSDNVPIFSPGGRFLILDGAGTSLYSKTEPVVIENADTLRVYDLDAGGRCVSWFNGQTSGDVSPDGLMAASIGTDKLLHVWDLASGKQLAGARLSDAAAAGRLVMPGTDARLVILRNDGVEAWILDAAGLRQTYNQTLPPPNRSRQLRDFRIDPTGRFVAVHRSKNGGPAGVDGGPDGEFLDLWALDDGRHLREVRQPFLAELGYAFDDAGRLALRTVAQPSPGLAAREKVEVYRESDGQGLAHYTFPDELPVNEENQAGGLAVGGGRLARLEMGSDFVNSVALSDAASGERLASVHSFFPDGDALVAPDGTYAASKNILQRLGVRVGNRIFPFEQFDLRLNRPDLLAARLGGDKEAVSPLELAYRKRLARMGLKTESPGGDWNLPEVSLDHSVLPPIAAGDSLPVRVTARDDKYPLDRLQFFVNDVPVFGAEGLKVPATVKAGTSYEKTVSVPLASGANKVQVSAFNVQGVESLRETFAVTRGSSGARLRPRLFLVTVGVKSYPNGMNLQFPVDDAQAVADFCRRTEGKDYSEVKTLPILEGDAVREKILAAREFLLGSGTDDTAMVYVAGHGLLDNDTHDYFFAPIDMDFATPAKRGVSYEQLEGLLDGIPALRKLLVLDTCAAGEQDPDAPGSAAAPAGTRLAAAGASSGPRGRGVAGVRPTEKKGLADARLMESFADIRRGSGAMVIAAAGAEEAAFEEGGHGYFTGSLLEGLGSGQADLDGDGRITVTELREYTARRVRSSSHGAQQPVLRRENLEMDFAVCTVPPRRTAAAEAHVETEGEATLPFLRGLAEAYMQAMARGDVEQSMEFFSGGTVMFDGVPVAGPALRARIAGSAERWRRWDPLPVGNPIIKSISIGNRAPSGDAKVDDDVVEFAMTFQTGADGAIGSSPTHTETFSARFVAADRPTGKTWTPRRWQITEMKLAPHIK